MKCECGVELFDTDIVHYDLVGEYDDTVGYNVESRKNVTYRCPKCFKVIRIKDKEEVKENDK